MTHLKIKKFLSFAKTSRFYPLLSRELRCFPR